MSVYVLRCTTTGLRKIGYSQEPAKRVSAIQCASPTALVLEAIFEGTMADEHRLHAHFSNRHVRGEWFSLEEGDVKAIGDLLPRLEQENPNAPHSRYVNAAAQRARDGSYPSGVHVCSFCGKGPREVERLVAGNCAVICNECTSLAADICNDLDPGEREAQRAALVDELTTARDAIDRAVRMVRS